MVREETAEWVGHYFGLQRAGNINVQGDGATINRLRERIDAAMKEVEAKLPPGTIDAWPQPPDQRRETNVKYGDYVEYDLRESHGGDIEQSYVIGEMKYSDDMSHVLLACPKYPLGMPIHSGHCKVLSGGHEAICEPLRAAYLKDWPKGLKPLPSNSSAIPQEN